MGKRILSRGTRRRQYIMCNIKVEGEKQIEKVSRRTGDIVKISQKWSKWVGISSRTQHDDDLSKTVFSQRVVFDEVIRTVSSRMNWRL